jgi:hypothetical protein
MTIGRSRCVRAVRWDGVAWALLGLAWGAACSAARAQVQLTSPDNTDASISLSGYVEGYYSYNFNRPESRTTQYRAFDATAQSFTVSNAVLRTDWHVHHVFGRLALQVGETPQLYYASEPSEEWKFLQEAFGGYAFDSKHTWSTEAGIFLTPIGPETIPIKESWNWSRSALFYALPYYHTGVRATHAWGQSTGQSGAHGSLVRAWVINAANGVEDNNGSPSVIAEWETTLRDALFLHAMYLGGVQRPSGAPEGQPWRNLFDFYARWTIVPTLQTMLHLDGGFEDNNFGMAYWYAGSWSTRWQAVSWLYLVGRADVFYSRDRGTPMYYPTSLVSAFTFTLDSRPTDHLSIRLEGRLDLANADVYLRTNSDLPNAATQPTVTLGAIAWF